MHGELESEVIGCMASYRVRLQGAWQVEGEVTG